MNFRHFASVLACLPILFVVALCPNAASADESLQSYDIEAQPLGLALRVFAAQTEIQVAFAPETVEGVVAQAVEGDYAPETALQALIDDSGLDYEFASEKLVVVHASQSNEQGGDSDSKNSSRAPVLMAQEQPPAPQSPSNRQNPENEDEPDSPFVMDEIVVVGSNIRGIAGGASPVLSYDRAAIDASGFTTTEQFVESIPQNFGGGPSEDTFTTSAGISAGNVGAGTGINLRGLGPDSTLILVNGRRTAPTGFDGAFVDISSIGLSAVERVEILTDGASAIYGSDAIGGVVNFVLRDDFDGAETRIGYGSVTDGGSEEINFGQLFGASWTSGSVLFSYDYYNRGALAAAERRFTADSDLTSLGGDNQGSDFSNPGNLFAGLQSFAIPSDQNGTGLTAADFLPGTLNLQNTQEGIDILPDVERHSLLFNARQQVSDTIELFTEARYSDRESANAIGAAINTLLVPSTNPFFVDPSNTGATSVSVRYSFIDDLGVRVTDATAEAFGAVLGSRIRIGATWQVEVYGSYAEDESANRVSNDDDPTALALALADPNPDTAFNPFGDGSNTNPDTLARIGGRTAGTDAKSTVWTGRILADGDLFSTPGGAVKLAIGAEAREENLETANFEKLFDTVATLTPSSDLDRAIYAGFGELFIPLVSKDNAISGIERLELSIAGRYEEYSDFGSSFDPKLGVLWSPFEDLILRGTYGTSFKAPLLTELDISNEISNTILFLPQPFFPLSTLLIIGNNAELEPETATTWTAGFEFKPKTIERLSLSLTYFSIEFEDRIEFGAPNLFDVFASLDEFAPILTLAPTESDVRPLVESPLFAAGLPITGTDPETGAPILAGIFPVEAIVDLRRNNIAATNVSGIDFAVNHGFDVGAGSMNLSLTGAHLFEFEQSLLSTQPLIDQISTIGHPVDLRLRGGASYISGAFSANAFVNYTDSYVNDQGAETESIGSWTTVDLQVSYDLSERTTLDLLSGTTLSLNVQNAFDEDPPFVNNRAGVGYDPTNASPIGRFVSFQLRKQW